jgi:hypothetical protein
MKYSAIIALSLLSTPALGDVRGSCTSDYLAYCSNTVPFSGPCRACMRRAGLAHLLSGQCIAALVAAGEVTSNDRKCYANKRRIAKGK